MNRLYTVEFKERVSKVWDEQGAGKAIRLVREQDADSFDELVGDEEYASYDDTVDGLKAELIDNVRNIDTGDVTTRDVNDIDALRDTLYEVSQSSADEYFDVSVGFEHARPMDKDELMNTLDEIVDE